MLDITYKSFGIMLVMSDSFSDWLNSELIRRDMTQAKLAKAAIISRTSVSDILSGKQKAGYDVCMAISRALHIAPENVLRAAGLWPRVPESDERESDLLFLYRSLSDKEKTDLVRYIRIRLTMQDEK